MKREAYLKKLDETEFDLLIIGGGATGTGTALEAAHRGLRVALVEREDFASETSSRSTKLLHGGVRYLEQAVLGFDFQQYQLVREALQERKALLELAPHLCQTFPILTPLYGYMEAPYYTMGLKMYDWISGAKSLGNSRYISAKEALALAPMLKRDKLRGAVLYYDGQFNDARMNVALAVTAAERGAVLCNHCELVEFTQKNKKLYSAQIRDTLTGHQYEVHARGFINATGPFVDTIRKLDDPETEPLLATSSGVHLVLPKSFSPPKHGILIPKTQDGRVIFVLPWLDHTLVGTTDSPATTEFNPSVDPEDIDFLLAQIKEHFSIEIQKKDILSQWCGLRPLVSSPKKSKTSKLSRDHLIDVSPTGLISITGGKWTTYRRMAFEVVDEAVKILGLPPRVKKELSAITLAGGENYTAGMAKELAETYALEPDIADHLENSYGSRASQVAVLSQKRYSKRLHPKYPYIEAEVVYGATNESARTPVDILMRRTRFGFLDTDSAYQCISRVAELLQETLAWDPDTLEQQKRQAEHYLRPPG